MSWQSKSAAVAIAIMAMSLHSSSVQAMPEQGKVVAGQGEIVRPDDKTMVINQKTDRLALDWQKFNIAKDEKVHFDQNSKSAIAINRVVGDGRSIIDGSLSATGNVFVINPNGVLFGKNSSVDVGGLVASTANVTDEDMRNFTQGKGDLGLQIAAGREASVINAGTIKAEGGLVALHATTVENTGTIANEGGTTALAAAKNLNIAADTAGKLNFTVNGSLANAKALNSGTLQNDGGYLVMTAKSAGDLMSTVVNNTGVIEAKTLHANDKGEILLDGGESGQVEVSGTLDASGTEAGQSAGSIKVIGQKTVVNDGTNLLARGAIDGGKIETSGDVLNLGDNLNIDAKGVNGKHGEWLLDPLDVYICDDDPTTTYDSKETDIKKYETDGSLTSSTSIGYNDPAATDANVSSVNSAVTWISTALVENMLNKGTNVTIQAAANNGSANIIVKNDIDKKDGGDATLTLDAMRNITLNGNISSTSNKLNVVLNADSNGDKIGAVIINGNINTNGGDFTSASGGTVTYKSDSAKTKGYGNGTLDGKADPEGHTVGTYFGHVNEDGTADGKKDDRLIKTGGGNITLNGEIAIGLNGGTLTLDSGGGAVTATGIINSGNSYGAYVYGTDTWNTLVEQTVENYLKTGTVPAYHYQGVNYVKDGSNYVKNADGTYKYTTEEQDFSSGQIHYTFKETDTENLRWLGNGTVSQTSEPGKGYSSVIVSPGSMNTAEYLAYLAVSAPATFLSRYEVSGATITIDGTPRTLTTKTSGNTTYLGYIGPKGGFNSLSSDQIQSVAQNAATLAQDSKNTTVMNNKSTAYANLTDDIKLLIANNWFVSKDLAQGPTKGASYVRDSYLATITTVLENSLTTPNGQQILWVGGRGSGVLKKTNDNTNPYSHYGMPADPLYQDGMYWVTGPEGEANKEKGTQFYSNEGSDWNTVSPVKDENGNTVYTYNTGSNVYGFVNWDKYDEKNVKTTDGKTITASRSQPDNSSPFLTVGYGTTGKWDDAAMGGGTTVGFVKETNLANSNLKINAGGGTVALKGDIGKSKALDTLQITSDAAVQIGDTSNDATKYHNGTVYVDHGLYIDGAGVKVGGEIHSGESEETDTSTTLEDKYKDNVTILSSGNIEVHGITSNTYDVSNKDGTPKTTRGGKISLTSTGDSGKITLGAGVDYDGNATAGTIAAGSSDNGAVIIDAQGKTGAFINKTDSKSPAITTGTDGTWQVYVASPSDYDTDLGDNLDSDTNAQWSSESTKHSATDDPDKNAADKDIGTYTDHTHNKFIFQVTPTITVSGQKLQKVYGNTLSDDEWQKLDTKATYTDANGVPIDVIKYKDKNFDESDYVNYIENGTTKGLANVTRTTKGAVATATRTGGDETEADGKTLKPASDGKPAFYNINVAYSAGTTGANGYALNKENGEIEITKRPIIITSNGEQTYGNETIKWTDTIGGEGVANKDSFTINHTIKDGSDYMNNKKEKGHIITADANETPYADSVDYKKSTIVVNDNPNFFNENYTLDTDKSKGSITVNKADLTLTLKDVATTYGKNFDESTYGYKKDKADLDGLANGDGAKVITDVLKDTDFTYINDGVKSDSNNPDVHTQNAGNYNIKATVNESAKNKLGNYNIKVINPGASTVNKAKLTLTVGDTSTTYGSGDWTPYTYTLKGEANGDTSEGIKNNGITVQYTNTGVKLDPNNPNVKTQNVGDWALNGAFELTGDTATNYEIDTGNSSLTGKATVSQVDLHLKLKDVSTTYGTAFDTTKYGYDSDKLVMLNGDDTSVVTNTIKNADIAYTNSGDETDPDKIKKGRVTKDAGNSYSLSGKTQKTLGNYRVIIDDANSTVNKATLLVDTAGGTKEYGNTAGVKYDLSKAATYHLEGDNDLRSVNGDDADAIETALNLGAKSDALIGAGDNEKTNNVRYNADGTYGGYEVTPVYNVYDPILKNYTVKDGVKGTEILTPKDVYFHVTGNGKTLGDVVYTVTDPNNPSSPDPINGQLVYGETVTPSYTPDGRLPNGHYGVSTSLPGYGPIESGKVYGNYRYHYDGDVTLTTPSKPDIVPPVNPPVTPGTGTVTPLPETPENTSNTPENTTETTGHKTVWDGDRDRGGDRPEDKRVVTLPFFKVLEDKTTHRYGTYDVAKRTTEVKIAPSAQVLPEPNQPATQYRELDTELTTDKGTGEFTLKYNGSRFTILPDDDAAMKLIVVGDETKNRALFEKALHVAFTQMGLEVADLDGVYIHFGKD